LSKEEEICPNCGLSNPAIAVWSFWQEFRRNGIPVLAFFLLGIVAWMRFERRSVSGVGGVLLLASVTIGLPAAFLFIFGRSKWGLPLVYLAMALALAGLLMAVIV